MESYSEESPKLIGAVVVVAVAVVVVVVVSVDPTFQETKGNGLHARVLFHRFIPNEPLGGRWWLRHRDDRIDLMVAVVVAGGGCFRCCRTTADRVCHIRKEF